MNQYTQNSRTLLVLLTLAALSGVGRAASAPAGGVFGRPATQRSEFLPVDRAFRVSAVAVGPAKVRVTWVIAPGYYLYRNRLSFAVASGGRLGSPALPRGESHTDDYFGTQIIYREILPLDIAVSRPAGASEPLTLSVGFQGCADAGLCYPPQTTRLDVAMPAPGR